MQSAIQPPVKVVFDDKMFESLDPATQSSLGAQREFGLIFTLNSVAVAEQITGEPLLSGMTRQQLTSPTVDFIRALFYAGLLACQTEITRSESDALITFSTWRPIWTAVLAAWVDAQADPDENQESAADPTVGQS